DASEREGIDGGTIFHGRTIRRQVDFDLLRSWIWTCDEAHGRLCSSYPFKEATKPSRLIDIDLTCVKMVKQANDLAYAALSYVWGPHTTKQRELNERTKSRLEARDGLSDSQVPRTIRDAMTVCSKIGIRYLWADALCIQQE
ncbi:hypothetical protein B0J12DRAFT_539089, partial [Macrophomina phaseolina]